LEIGHEYGAFITGCLKAFFVNKPGPKTRQSEVLQLKTVHINPLNLAVENVCRLGRIQRVIVMLRKEFILLIGAEMLSLWLPVTNNMRPIALR
jgi:hypothetical protein